MSTEAKIVNIGHNSGKTPPKSARTRAKLSYERRRAEGWKKGWIDPATQELAEQLGGIEHIREHRDELVELVRAQDEALRVLGEELQEHRKRDLVSLLLRFLRGKS